MTSRTTVTGGGWVHAPQPMKTSNLVDRDRLLLLFPSVPAVHLPVTCTRSKNTQTQQMAVNFNLFLPCRSVLGSVFYLLCCRSVCLFVIFSSIPCIGDKCWRPEQRVAPLGKGAVAVGFGGRWVSSSSSPLLRVADRWLDGDGRTTLFWLRDLSS